MWNYDSRRRRKWQPTPVFSHGKSPGQRSLVGYSPWGRKESDMTETEHLAYDSRRMSLGMCLEDRTRARENTMENTVRA